MFWLRILFRLTAIAPGLVRAAKPLFIRLAWISCPGVRKNVKDNFRNLNPKDFTDARLFGLAVLGSFYDFISDIGQSQRMNRGQLRGRVESVVGAEAYLAARLQKKGAVLATAHMGSFEVGLAALPVEERRIHVVYKPDRLPGFERLRAELRLRLNVTPASVDDGPMLWMRLREALLFDEVVAVQADRVMPGQKGMTVPLLHGEILLPTGPYKLALSAGAPVIPIFSVRLPDGRVRIVIDRPIQVADSAQGIANALREFAVALERRLKEHPDQWLVLERAFADNSV